MSFGNFLGDIVHGNFSHALKRLEDEWQTLPQPLKDFIHKWSSDEAVVLQNALIALGSSFFAGKSIPDAAAAALAELEAQGIKAAEDDVRDAIRLITTGASPLAVTVIAPPTSDSQPTGT